MKNVFLLHAAVASWIYFHIYVLHNFFSAIIQGKRANLGIFKRDFHSRLVKSNFKHEGTARNLPFSSCLERR